MFSDELKELFIKSGGTRVERIATPMPANGIVEFGLYISSEPEVHAIVVKEALEGAGFTLSKLATVPGGDARMTLYVGHKPR